MIPLAHPATRRGLAAVLASTVVLLTLTPLWADSPRRQGTPAGPERPAAAADDSVLYVAYYFHGDVRCATCRKLEQYSEAAVREGFAGEMESARLAWRAVNVDRKENEHYTRDFQLYTRSLVLVAERDGKAIRWKNLPRIWELVRDPEAFASYVRKELREFMKAPS